ncbi:MAG: TonB-dependent receptor [Burkholderiales bacterium]|nr:TonB-dependent receptor [Burkholderiales bacterium]
MKFQRKKVAIALGVGGVALVAGGSVVAQDIRVNVTGTNIKRVDTETSAPIEVITREDIQASGLQTIQEVVRQITANNNGGIAPSFTNGFSASGSAVSLRGLGPNNTLVLVNGRRLANFGLADDGHASYPDLGQLPFDAVERIEVLKDGASAIYGSDAVAGVVNVILRQQFTGFTATGTYGTDYKGNADQWKVALTGGIGDLTKDRYNAFVSFDYQKQDPFPSNKARDYMGSNDLRSMGGYDQRLGNPFVLGINSVNGNVRPVNPATNALVGTYQPLPGACPTGILSDGFCLWETKDWTDHMPEIERANVYARGAFNFTPDIQGYTELSYFKVTTDTRGTPTAMRGNWFNPQTLSIVSSTGTANLPVGHPDNPFSANGQAARMYYTDAALGGRDAHYETDTQRYLLGVKGATAGWDWDLAGLYIRSDTDVTRKNFYSYDRMLQGLAGTGPYGYYRVGANANLNNPAIYDWIAPDRSWSIKSENTIFDAKASRDIYKLQGGQMALAVGYQFMKEELSNPGTPGTETGNVVGLGYSAAFGSRDINALFAELYAPVLKNLEITAAIRWDDYSDVDSTWNPKIGAKWTIIPSLVLRGTWATAFRAPGLYETSTANASAGFTTASDPIRCPVTGAAADCQGTVLGINTGNPFIKPETSDTWTVGVIWEPVPGLSGTLDYWNIETQDQITIGSVQGVLNNPGNFPAATIGRDSNNLPGIPNSGTVLYVQTPYQNANTVKTDGIDLDIVWRIPTKDWGTFTPQFQWTHIFNYSQTLGGIEYKYAGTNGNYDVSSAQGTPEDRWNLILGWSRGPWTATGTVRFVSGYDEIPWEGEPVPDACLWHWSDDQTGCSVDSFTTFDLSASYKGFKNWEIFGSIINVFNEKAPFAPAAAYGLVNYNYNYSASGATGTQFNLGVRYTFN